MSAFDAVYQALDGVAGWFGDGEAALLYSLALACPPHATIVEIGSYQGRSAIALALGAQECDGVVWSIDPHHAHMVEDLPFGPADNVAFMQNILRAGVAEYIRLINLPSQQAIKAWEKPIALLFIDGAHDYDSVKADFEQWGVWTNTVALHDVGTWDGPTRVVEEALASEVWYQSPLHDDYTVVLHRKEPRDGTA